MISTNTVRDSANVTFTSVLGTTFRCPMPNQLATFGSRSTGSRSIELNRKTQAKMVSASGAISLVVPWKVSLTVLSMNSTSSSTNAWKPRGTSLVIRALRAAI